MSARGRLQWVEELVGGTEVEMASVDKFLKKLSCEEERGTGGDVEAGRGFWFPDGKDLSFYKWEQEGGNKEGTVENVGDRKNG